MPHAGGKLHADDVTSDLLPPRFLKHQSTGITHDNYFLYLIMNLPTSAHPPMSDAWHYIEIQRIIDENIDRFEREERWNELAKWSWFQKRLELSGAGFMKSFRESGPEALREMERRHEPRIRWGLP